jgi:hypothetical protein
MARPPKVDLKLNPKGVRDLTGPNGVATYNAERRGRLAQAAARRLAPSPRFARSIKYELVPKGDKYIVTLTASHKAAIFVIKGTRRHIIRPRKPGGVLVFKIGGRKVFARYVNHPGNKPNDFMVKALREAMRPFG